MVFVDNYSGAFCNFAAENERQFFLQMKKLTITFVLLLCIVFGASAQEGGGLFGLGPVLSDMEYSNRGGLFDPTSMGGYNLYNQQFGSDVIGGYELYNQTFGQDAPLGSGLLILATSGACYALKKRKNNKKQ